MLAGATYVREPLIQVSCRIISLDGVAGWLPDMGNAGLPLRAVRHRFGR